MKDKTDILPQHEHLMIKNFDKNTFDHLELRHAHFDLFADTQGKKIISMHNTAPVKYSILATNAELDIDINTACDGAELQVFLLTPVIHSRSSKINVNLNLLHNNCKIDLHIVSLVFSDAKSQASATIYMAPGIQESSSELLEESVILGNAVNIRNLPILDIQANNIAAAHGAKIYRLDEQKLFYLQSKWLSAAEARALLISSYPNMLFEEVLEDEALKNQITAEFLDFDAHYYHA